MLSRFSFRQLLLAAFLFIAALLSGASLHVLFTLERLAAHSRDTARDAVRLTENAQALAERTVAMERSARQFMILSDPAFRARYQEALLDARGALAALATDMPHAPREEFVAWTMHSDAAWNALQTHGKSTISGEGLLQQAFKHLSAIGERLAAESKREVDRRNDALLEELDRQRDLLASEVGAVIVLAVLLAFSFGIWLARPLKQIETAIERLGKNRFDQAVKVRGPTDLRRLGTQLDWLRQRLADLEADKARFLRHVSHELKTPLAALREGVALLEDEVAGQLSNDQREIARILRQNTLSLQTQIEDLLRYNAATFGAQNVKRVPVDLRALLCKTIDDQRLQWQVRGLRIEVDGAPRSAAFDAEKLAIVFGNLLSNAIRFSPERGLVRFVLAEEPGRIGIDCIDEGPGIAENDAGRIFEPFYQGERQPSGARHGSGIGLSIVREYVEAHGGSVQLLPSTKGAHFRIEFANDN